MGMKQFGFRLILLYGILAMNYLSSFYTPLPHPRGLSGRTHRSLKPCFPRADMQVNGGEKKKAQGQSHLLHQWDCFSGSQYADILFVDRSMVCHMRALEMQEMSQSARAIRHDNKCMHL